MFSKMVIIPPLHDDGVGCGFLESYKVGATHEQISLSTRIIKIACIQLGIVATFGREYPIDIVVQWLKLKSGFPSIDGVWRIGCGKDVR